MPFDDTTGYLKQQEQTADPFSLESLTRWLEEQYAIGRAEDTYPFSDCAGRCLIGQYLVATTGKMWTEHGLCWRDFAADIPILAVLGGRYRDFGLVAAEHAIGRAAGGRDGYTFGAALSRARALLASRKSPS